MAERPSRNFPTTAWSLIKVAQEHDEQAYVPAMNRFIAGYWKPIFYFLRVRGYSLHQAEDLTQEFFLRFLAGDWISKADPNRGKFRTFLLTILVRFLSDQGPKRSPKQKQFERQLVSISTLIGDEERTFEPPTHETAEDIFMKKWALAVIGAVGRRLEIWCEERGRPDWYQVFASIHFPDATGRRLTQDAAAQRFSLSRDQVRYAVEQIQKEFIAILRSEVADQIGGDADVDTEIRELQLLLGH